MSDREDQLVESMKKIEFLRKAVKDYEEDMGRHPNMLAWLESRRDQYIESRIKFYQELERKKDV